MTDVPDGWGLERVDAIATFHRGVTFTKGDASPDEREGTVPVLRAGNIQNGRIVWGDLVYVPRAFVSSDQTIREGDIVLAMSSGSALVVGKAAPVSSADARRAAGFGAFCGLWRPQSQDLAEWLSHFFQTPQYRTAVAEAAQGVNINNLRADHVGSLVVPVPPHSEQVRIVAKLDELLPRSHRAKQALVAVPLLLEKLRHSTLAAAFRGDLTADWRAKNPDVEPAAKLLTRVRAERRRKWEEAELAKMTARRKSPTDDRWRESYAPPRPAAIDDLPDLPEGWCWAAAGELIEGIQAGASFTCEERPPVGDEVGVAKVSAVTWGRYDEGESKTCRDSDRVDAALFVRPGDFLFSRANTIDLVGACVISQNVSRRIMLSDKILRFSVTSGCADLLLWALRSPWGRREIEGLSTGNQLSMRNIGQERIREIRVPLPPLEEAAEIVRRLDAAQRVQEAIHDARLQCGGRLGKLEAAILSKAFRGELVPQDPNDEPADVLLARLRSGSVNGGAPHSAKSASAE